MASATSESPRSSRRSEATAGYLFIAIPMALFLVLNIGSIFYALYISVWKWNIRSGPVSFLGLDNYTDALADPVFQTAVRNGIYYAVVWVPTDDGAGPLPGTHRQPEAARADVLPRGVLLPGHRQLGRHHDALDLHHGPDGLFNDVRAALGLDPLFELFGISPHQNWIGDQGTAMNTVIVLNAWTTSGTFMLFYLASLQSISNTVYEAAAIDGASWWQAFWRMTMPLLRPGHYFVATVAVIGALQLFDQAIIGGGVNGDPNNALMTMVLYLYNAAFRQFNFSYAAAIGVILFVLIMSATLVQRRLFGAAPSW